MESKDSKRSLMENKPFENMSDLSARMDAIEARLAALESALRKLGPEHVGEEEFTPDLPPAPVAIAADEAIDLSLDIIPEAVEDETVTSLVEDGSVFVGMPVVEGDPAAEEVPVPEDAPVSEEVPVSEDAPVSDGFPADSPAAGDVVQAEEVPLEVPEAVDLTAAEAEADVLPEQAAEEMSEPEDMPSAEDMPVVAVAEEPEDLPGDEEGFGNLFGAEFGDVPQHKPRRGRKPSVTTLNEKAVQDSGNAVMDVLAQKRAWLHDMPGPEVKSLRSAIALGDQVLFIRRLFRDDSALYQDSIDKLNAMPALEKALEYLTSTFPEWDMDSEDVYRFMMALRRRIRK